MELSIQFQHFLIALGLLLFSICAFPVGGKKGAVVSFLSLAGFYSFSIWFFSTHQEIVWTELFYINSDKAYLLKYVSVFCLVAHLANGWDRISLMKNSLLLPFMLMGSVFLVASTEFITFFIALELISLMGYTMISLSEGRFSKEAAMKYFIQGSTISAIFLLATAFFFGSTGSFNFSSYSVQNESLFIVSVALFFIVLMFKLGVLPFHGWLADVYSNASRSAICANFLISKFVFGFTFITLLQNLLHRLTGPIEGSFAYLIIGFAFASALYGNVIGLGFKQKKPIAAYSSVAHGGYMLLTLLLAYDGKADRFLVYYLAFYALSACGLMLVLNQVSEKRNMEDNEKLLDGLFFEDKWSAFLISVFILSMAGMPLTSGFVTKYMLFTSFFKEGHIVGSFLVFITSAVGLGFYVRFLVHLFMHEALTQDEIVQEAPFIKSPASSKAIKVITSAMAMIVLLAGVLPSIFIR